MSFCREHFERIAARIKKEPEYASRYPIDDDEHFEYAGYVADNLLFLTEIFDLRNEWKSSTLSFDTALEIVDLATVNRDRPNEVEIMPYDSHWEEWSQKDLEDFYKNMVQNLQLENT
ncbi:MAG TPA: hypothetical protein DEA55_11225 [Rhodospirillaceae bacterium]|nr:hypothetical protein [Rhodospirillaceae bacterium]